MRLIPVSQLRADSVLALDIIDEDAKKLLAKGHVLNQTNISRLRTTNVASVYITDKYCYNEDTIIKISFIHSSYPRLQNDNIGICNFIFWLSKLRYKIMIDRIIDNY